MWLIHHVNFIFSLMRLIVFRVSNEIVYCLYATRIWMCPKQADLFLFIWKKYGVFHKGEYVPSVL